MKEGERPAGDALHADLAGAVTGQVAGALAPGQLIGHWCGRRLGEFWVQEVAVAGEAAATRGWRDEDLLGEGGGDRPLLVLGACVVHGADWVQRERRQPARHGQPQQQPVMGVVDAVQQRERVEPPLVLRIELRPDAMQAVGA